MHPAQIKAAIEVAGYKQVDLAGEMGLAANTVSAVIKGRSRSRQVEERIAAITGYTLEELWPQWHGKPPLVLSDDERALVLLYRELPPFQKEQVLPVIREMTRDVRGATLLSSGSKNVIANAPGSIAAGRGVHYHDHRPSAKPKKK